MSGGFFFYFGLYTLTGFGRERNGGVPVIGWLCIFAAYQSYQIQLLFKAKTASAHHQVDFNHRPLMQEQLAVQRLGHHL